MKKTIILLTALSTLLTTSCSQSSNVNELPEREILRAYHISFNSENIATYYAEFSAWGKVSEVIEEKYFVPGGQLTSDTQKAVYYRTLVIDIEKSSNDFQGKMEFIIHSDMEPTFDISNLKTGDEIYVLSAGETQVSGSTTYIPSYLGLVDSNAGVLHSLNPHDQEQIAISNLRG